MTSTVLLHEIARLRELLVKQRREAYVQRKRARRWRERALAAEWGLKQHDKAA